MRCVEHGVDTVFGYIGASVIPLFDRLYDSPIRFVVPCHEQGGCHMADAYARASGKIGVMIATSGPGACNLVTGLATAMMDSIPLVAITGQVRTDLIGDDAFQEAPTTGITRSVTKHSSIVMDIKDLEQNDLRSVSHRFDRPARPGPGRYSGGSGVSETQRQWVDSRESARLQGPEERPRPADQRGRRGDQPVRAAGPAGRRRDHHGQRLQELRDLVAQGESARGDDPDGPGQLRPGPAGVAGHARHARGAPTPISRSRSRDLLIAVGARFDDRVTGKLEAFAPKAKVIHIDIDPANISKTVQADIPIVGDAKVVLPALTELVEHRDRHGVVRQDRRAQKAAMPVDYDRNAATIKPQYVIEELSRRTTDKTIITTGVGQHQMFAAQFYKFSRPRQLITSGGLGTMGFGLPAAIGTQIARPEATVIDIDGDHSFNMTMAELSTAVQHELPIKVCIFNNGYMGMIRQWQELFYAKRYFYSHLREPGLCGLRPGGRGRRHYGRVERPGRTRHRADAGRGGALRGRFPRRSDGECLPDGPRGQEPQRNGGPANPAECDVTGQVRRIAYRSYRSHPSHLRPPENN